MLIIDGIEVEELGWVATEAEHRRHHLPRVPDNVPVPVLLARLHPDYADGSMWQVWCPWCKFHHDHGAGDGGRVAHCNNDKGSQFTATGYIIVGPQVQKYIKHRQEDG